VTVTDNKQECYCVGKTVLGLLVTYDGLIVAGVSDQLQLINRKNKIIKRIGNPQ
jgi:hypothetical protein